MPPPRVPPPLHLPLLLLLVLSLKVTHTTGECALYLAPSKTCDGQKLCYGLYSGISAPANTNLASPEILLPVPTDLFTTNLHFMPYANYHTTLAATAADGFNHFVPGIGLVPAPTSPGKVNAVVVVNEEATTTTEEETTTTTTSTSKDHDARSSLPPVTLRTIRPILAGEELSFRELPTKSSGGEDVNAYGKALNALYKFKSHVTSMTDDGVAMTPELMRDLFTLIRDRAVEEEVREALPTVDKLEDILRSEEGRPMEEFLVVGDRAVEDMEYLRDYGYCMDGLQVGTSTVRDAGRGAFAKEYFGTGDIVLPVAVMPVLRESLEIDESEGGFELLLNYCLGHQDSDVFLFPVTPLVNYINHAMSAGGREGRKGGTMSANVKLRAASEVYEDDSDIADMKVDELMVVDDTVVSPTIIFELVATRDIQPGEEIFMDYGDVWDKAWKKYERDWIGKDYAPVAVWNAKKTSGEPIRTYEEEAYPKNVYLTCFVNVGDLSQDRIVWKRRAEIYDDKNLYYCRIMERKEVEHGEGTQFEYTVELDFDDNLTITVEKMPQEAIWFEEETPYEPTVFRHFIGVPDKLWPSKWMAKGKRD